MPSDPFDPNPAIPGYPNNFSGPVVGASAQAQPLTAGPPNLGVAGLAAAKAGAPTGTTAETNAVKADQTLSSGTAKPCPTCKKTDFSVAFRVKDKNGNLCKGMWYSIFSKTNGGMPGTTDDDGLTQRYPGDTKEEEIYLYLGHRDDLKSPPISRETTDNTYDEAPLKQDHFYDVADEKIVDAQTERLWKPWNVSTKYKAALLSGEKKSENPYPSPEGGLDTIGEGHKITPAEQKNGRFTKGYWKAPLSDPKMDELRDEDIRKNGGDRINNSLFVPLYDHEYDALIDLSFNGGPGALSADARSAFDADGVATPKNSPRTNLGATINSGRYHLAKSYLSQHYNTAAGKWSPGVQNRRDMDARMFPGDADGYEMQYTHHSR